MALLLRQTDVTLPNLTSDGIEADLLLAKRLAPLAMELELLLRRVKDTILQAESEAWHGATAGYTVLKRLASHDADLQLGLEPAKTFFGAGKKREPRAPKPA